MEQRAEYNVPVKRLSNKRAAFVAEYLKDFNATQAAIRAGYAKRSARQQGQFLLTIHDIDQAVQAGINEKAMSSDEILLRLSEHARGDIGDLMDIESMSFNISLQKAKELGLTHLIKKVKQRTVITSNKDGEETETDIQEIELYSAQEALDKLAKIRGMYKDSLDLTSAGKALEIVIKYASDIDPPSGNRPT